MREKKWCRKGQVEMWPDQASMRYYCPHCDLLVPYEEIEAALNDGLSVHALLRVVPPPPTEEERRSWVGAVSIPVALAGAVTVKID